MSPVAHCGMGILGWRYFSGQKNYKTFFLFLLIANLPDLDFIINIFLFFKNKKEWLGITLVAYSHLLLDILVIDRASPIGIRLFYPLSDKLFNIGVFPHLLRGNFAEIVSISNFLIILLEAALFILPLYFLFRKDIIKHGWRFQLWES